MIFKKYALIFFLFGTLTQLKAQENSVIGRFNASNPNLIEKQFGLDFENYFFVANDKLVSLNFRLDYNFNSKRTLVSFIVPVHSTNFSKDYQGYERSTGIGDLGFKINYLLYLNETGKTAFESLALGFKVTTPTGDSSIGLGLGKWQYIPSVVAAFRPNPAVGIYPGVKFQFTGSEVNGQPTPGGSVPDPEDPEAESQFQTMIIDMPTNFEMNSWQGWFGLNPIFLRDFAYEYSIFALRADLGKMVSDQTAISLRITQNIAGEKRLLNVIEAKLNFYFN